MDRQSAPPHARNVAVIVAHGVGEAEPGYAATTLLETLDRCPNFEADQVTAVRNLADPLSSVKDRTFPVYVGSGRLGDGTRVTFAELYWADLSKIGPSRADAFLGFFRIIFESHHLVDGMLQGAKGAGPWLLRHLLLFASFLLRGPIIGLVVPTLALLAAALYVPPSFRGYLSEAILFSLVSALLFLASGTVLFFAVRRLDRTWYDATAWTAFVAAVLAVGFAAVEFLQIAIVSGCPEWPGAAPDCRQNYVDYVYKALGRLWFIWGGAILVCFAIAASIAVQHRKDPQNAPPVFTALGIVLMQFVLWTALMGTVAMPLIYRVEEVKGIYALHQDEREEARKSNATSRPPLPEVAVDPSARKLFDVVPWDPKLAPWVERLSFGYAMNGLIILCVLVVGWATHMYRGMIARGLATDAERRASEGDQPARQATPGEAASRSDVSDRARAMPRMLVGQGILVALLFLTFFQALYLLLQLNLNVFLTDSGGGKRSILALGWVATLVLSLLASFRIGNFVHIARDLIDHQYSPKRASALARLKKENRIEVWPRRARIQSRLEKVFDEMIRNGNFNHVVFAVHSQGSVIAYDYLRDNASVIKGLLGSPPDVVTFGSPLSHLYQYYFTEYHDLEKDIASLQDDIGRWVNVFRIDDYIGTVVAPGEAAGVDNRQIGCGGHTDYWREDSLAAAILGCCPAATAPAGPATAAP